MPWLFRCVSDVPVDRFTSALSMKWMWIVVSGYWLGSYHIRGTIPRVHVCYLVSSSGHPYTEYIPTFILQMKDQPREVMQSTERLRVSDGARSWTLDVRFQILCAFLSLRTLLTGGATAPSPLTWLMGMATHARRAACLAVFVTGPTVREGHERPSIPDALMAHVVLSSVSLPELS